MLTTKNLIKAAAGLALAVPFFVATAFAAEPEAPAADNGAAPAPQAPGPGVGQRPPRPDRMMGGGRMMQPGMMPGQQNSGIIFARMLSRPEFVKDMGLPEEAVAKITEGLKKIEEQEKALFEERQKLMKAQTDAMAALMSDRTKNGDDVRKASADLEALQTKLFGLNVDRMLLVRDNLTDEQIKQASELVKKRFEARREEMMRRRGGGRPEGEGPRGRGPGGFGNRGPAGPGGEKEAPPPPPPKEGVAAPEAAK